MPPQEPEYHFHTAPSVLRLPPVMLIVDEDPVQIEVGLDKAEVGTVDNGLTVIVVLIHNVVLHVPSALTQ